MYRERAALHAGLNLRCKLPTEPLWRSRWQQRHSLPSTAAATDGCKALSVATLSPSDRPCRELVVRLGSSICSGMGTGAPRNSFSWSKRLGANIPVTKLASSLSKSCRRTIFSESAQREKSCVRRVLTNRSIAVLGRDQFGLFSV